MCLILKNEKERGTGFHDLTKTFISRGADGGDPREQCQRTSCLLLAFSPKHPLAPCLLTFLGLFHPSRQNSCLLVERTMKRQKWFNGTEEVTPGFLNVIFETWIHWFFFHSFWFVSSSLWCWQLTLTNWMILRRFWMMINCWICAEVSLYLEPFYSRSKINLLDIFYTNYIR